MNAVKTQLLMATIISGGVPTLAHAQFAYPAAELRGAGATAIQSVMVQTLNCNGNPGSHAVGNTDNLNPLGTGNGTTSTIVEGKFVQTNPTAKSPDFDCNLQEIQPNFQAKYVAIGSGTGRAWWRTFTNQLPGTPGLINPFGTWTNLDFAFSPAPIEASDLAEYDADAGNSTNAAGAPIQFPLFVLPVALAYNPVYGRLRTANGIVNLSYAVKPEFVTKDAAGNPTGGLRLTRNLYCKIFNGYVTNFNDPLFKATGTSGSLMDPADSATRWKSVGVPIRLVGRIDNAGTTDILSRHLAIACAGQKGVTVNKFQRNSEALPYNVNSGPDLRSFRADTRYYPSTPSTPNTSGFAGTVQSLSGAVFIRAGSSPARIDVSQGAEQPGLFMVADGSSGHRDAINFQTDPSATIGDVALNGKFGYAASDFVKPSVGAQLYSAALQIGGTGTKYASANPTDALLAFGQTRYLPPQSTAATGAYAANDSRTGPRRDGQAGTVPIDRANPLHWTSVLYSDPNDTLAAPRLGYPITGTTQYLGYTCYADPTERAYIVEFLSLYTGKLTKDANGDAVSTNIFKGTDAKAPGLLVGFNIATMPQAWLTAINDTFLVKSKSAALAAKNLWIQDKLPTKSIAQSKSSPTCTEGKGA